MDAARIYPHNDGKFHFYDMGCLGPLYQVVYKYGNSNNAKHILNL